jgi:hypothetical protein
MMAPRYIAHPCNPSAIVFGVELEPGDVLQIGDVFCGVTKLGMVPSEVDRRLTSGMWLPLERGLANHRVGSRVLDGEITSWVRPMSEPCRVCESIRDQNNVQCAQHPTRMVP